MPRGGRKGGHKGRSRKFNNPEEIDDQMRAHQWREPAKEGSGDEESTKQPAKTISDTDSDSDSDEGQSRKGVSHLIEIENPNRVVNKMKKASQVDVNESGTAALSRRERKEIEKEEATQRYLKLHREGKTPEAQADLARLAIIRKEREEAAKKREQEKKAKEEAKAAARKK